MNKVVLVTGSSRGLGKSIIEKYAKNNYDVVINCKNSVSDAEKLKHEIEEKYQVKAVVIQADISNEDDVKEMFSKIITEFNRIDVVVNNAAIENTCYIKSKTSSSFLDVLKTNLIGTFLVSMEASNYMKEGSIINISSDNSFDKYDSNTIEYDTSKAGVNILTKVLAREFAPSIRVNGVAPGWILNEKNRRLDEELNGKFIICESTKISLKRFAECEEIADVVYFLSTDNASYINGEIIKVDGGC